jgi:hypothetical protein
MELAESIDLAEHDHAELARLRSASRSRAGANYRWPDIVSSYAELLEQVGRS